MAPALQTEKLSALLEVARTLSAHLDLDTVLRTIMDVASDLLEVDASSLVLVDDATGDLLFHLAQGEKAQALQTIRMKPGEGVVGWVVEQQATAVVNDVADDPRVCRSVDAETGFVTRNILCAPLATKTRAWGALEVLNKRGGRSFDEQDRLLCEALASQAAVSVENAVFHRRMVEAERLSAVGEAVAGMAHCLRNALTGVRGGSYLLDQGIERSDLHLVSQGWGLVKGSSQFLQDLVFDMLTFSRSREPEREAVGLDDLVRPVCEMVAARAEAQGTAVIWQPPDPPRTVHVDPKGIRRCLLNLVGNALDTRSGEVRVRAALHDGMLHLSVEDDGPGIPDEHRDKLFRTFFSTKGSEGTGLGLAVTHKIVAEHGGSVSVHSRPGEGATFTMRLPC